jgi:TonB family protein
MNRLAHARTAVVLLAAPLIVFCATTIAMAGAAPGKPAAQGAAADSTADEAFLAYDVPPRAIKIFAPEYPSQAQRARVEGTVHVRMTISETGRVIETTILRSDTIPILEASALHAAQISLFRPALLAGRPVRSRLVFPFPFQVK